VRGAYRNRNTGGFGAGALARDILISAAGVDGRTVSAA
jgi:hypothetical protein